MIEMSPMPITVTDTNTIVQTPASIAAEKTNQSNINMSKSNALCNPVISGGIGNDSTKLDLQSAKLESSDSKPVVNATTNKSPSQIHATNSLLAHVRPVKAVTSRKLRKSCSLPTCSQRPGECMHCTCDGRCGQHEGGKCGVRREGSGKSCKRPGCPKDDTCLHSTRATCCHCRNLVSSQSRSMKAKRAQESISTNQLQLHLPNSALNSSISSSVDAKRRKKLNATSSNDVMEPNLKGITARETGAKKNTSQQRFDSLSVLNPSLATNLKAVKNSSHSHVNSVSINPSNGLAKPFSVDSSSQIQNVLPGNQVLGQPAATASQIVGNDITFKRTIKSLCEYNEYKYRAKTCNLVVVVEGQQFNLHKFPMLLACKELKLKLTDVMAKQSQQTSVSSSVQNSSPISVLKYATFPGGALAFELACIYAYTGEYDVNPENVAHLYVAARILKMDSTLTSRTALHLENIVNHSRITTDVVKVLLQVVDIRKCVRNPSTDRMMAMCIHSLSQKYRYDIETMVFIQKLPCEVFLHLTQVILSQSGAQLSSNVVAKLCAQAHLAQVYRNQFPTAILKATELVKVLNEMLSMDQNSMSTQIVRRVEVNIEQDFLTNQTNVTSMNSQNDSTTRILAQALNQALAAN